MDYLSSRNNAQINLIKSTRSLLHVPYITVGDKFIIIPTFIYKLHFLCFVDDRLPDFVFICLNFWDSFPCIVRIQLCSSSFIQLMNCCVFQTKQWEMKEVFWVIDLKIKIKISLCVKEFHLLKFRLNDQVLELTIWIVIKVMNLVQNNQKFFHQTPMLKEQI